MTDQNKSLKTEKNSFPSLMGILLIAAGAIIAINWILNYETNVNQNTNQNLEQLPKFASCNTLYDQLKEGYDQGGSYDLFGGLRLGIAPLSEKSVGEETGGGDYSQTNIQVAGVDEADIVKTDGKYIYTVSGQIITISQADPVAEAKLLSKISLDSNSAPIEIFIQGNNLLIFGNAYSGLERLDFPSRYSTLTFVEIYNLNDPTNPTLMRRVELEGNYHSSRKINNYVYFVLNSYPDYQIFDDKPESLEDNTVVPVYRDLQKKELVNRDKDFDSMVQCASVSYIDPIVTNQYLTVIGLPIDDYDGEINREVILGGSENIYASLKNLYVANTNYQYSDETFLKKIIPGTSSEETVVYKFSLDQGMVLYRNKATVPGTILNQFSMDEHKDNFRIATTIGQVSQTSSKSTNNVYVLDRDLKIVGALEDIAPGEKIYSARFMGDKAYLVTFKKVDPFFTLDVSDPYDPKVVGKLKIPGYSDYLHPYDEDHIIGIGKETVEAEEGSFAWYQGMKMAIFDVTDFANPKEMHKIVIGDRGTDSPILTDHKALLFSKEKNLLVLPILLAEISSAAKEDPNTPGNTYGDFVYQGSYVYKITLEKGFELIGRVTHFEDEEAFKKSGYYFDDQEESIKRNLYIKESLYSVSDSKIKINSLIDLSGQGEISLK